MKAFMMSLISTQKKRSSGLPWMMTTAQVTQRKRVKVRAHSSLAQFLSLSFCTDVPPRTPSKKHDEESVSSKREEHSPVLKKATVATIQSRSKRITPSNVLEGKLTYDAQKLRMWKVDLRFSANGIRLILHVQLRSRLFRIPISPHQCQVCSKMDYRKPAGRQHNYLYDMQLPPRRV